jgi:hypothetical protein
MASSMLYWRSSYLHIYVLAYILHYAYQAKKLGPWGEFQSDKNSLLDGGIVFNEVFSNIKFDIHVATFIYYLW